MTAAPREGTERISLLSIWATALLAILKLSVAGSSGSLALLSSALDAGLDLALSVMTWVLVRMSTRRRDAGTQRERLRLEQIGALVQTSVLIGLGGFVLQAAVRQLASGAMSMRMSHTGVAVATTIVAAVVDLWRSVALGRAARQSGSAVLAAAALGFRLDFFNTLVVLVGLTSVGMGHMKADALAAVTVSGVMMVSALRLLRETLRTLPAPERDRIAAAVGDALAARPETLLTHATTAERFGERVLCEVTVTVDGALPLREAAALSGAVRARVEAALPHVECQVTVVPPAPAP